MQQPELPPVPVGTAFEIPDQPERIVGMVLASAPTRVFVEIVATDRADHPAGRWVVDDYALHDGSWPISRAAQPGSEAEPVPRFACELRDGRPALARYSPETLTVTTIEPISPEEVAERDDAPNLLPQDVARFLWSVRQSFGFVPPSDAPAAEPDDVVRSRALVAIWRQRLANVDAPLAIDFFADFKSVESARRAAADPELPDSSVSVVGRLFRRSATLTYREAIVPAYPLVARVADRFAEIVARYDGVPDGFGAALT